jgi:hypothetical protein
LGAAFIGCNNLKIISAFPSTSRITDFQSLFHSCHALEWIPPSICETQNAPNLNFMFYLCSSLKKVPGTFNTSNCTFMSQLFQDCQALKRVPAINTSKVTSTNMAGLFAGCRALEEIPGEIDAVSATSLGSLFFGCDNLRYLPKIKNTSNITNFSLMFAQTRSLEQVPYLDTTAGTLFNDMFNTSAITNLDAWGNTFNMPNATNTSNMFRFGRTLERVPNTFVTGATLTTANAMFYGCYKLTNCPNINLSGVANISEIFYDCRGIKEIPNIQLRTNTAGTYTNMFFQNWSLSSCGMSGFTGANVDFSNNSLGATALNTIYTNLGTVGASGAGARTITVSGNWGNAADNPAIAIAKGWTVTG